MNIQYNSKTCCWEFLDKSWNAFDYNLTQVLEDILTKEESKKNTQKKEEKEEYDSEDPRDWSDEEALKRGYTEYGDIEGACHAKLMEEEGIPLPEITPEEMNEVVEASNIIKNNSSQESITPQEGSTTNPPQEEENPVERRRRRRRPSTSEGEGLFD